MTLTDCRACGHPVDPADPQPCETGGTCRPDTTREDTTMNPDAHAAAQGPDARALWAELTTLSAFMEERTSDAIKAGDEMDPEDLAEAVAFLQDVRRQLGEVERDLTIALGQKMGKGTGSLADGRMFTVERSSTRTEWDHDDWKRDARRAIVENVSEAYHATEGLVSMGTGEEVTLAHVLHDALAQAQEVHGSTAPRSRALKALGLFASDYSTSKPAGWRFTAVAPHDTTTEKKDA